MLSEVLGSVDEEDPVQFNVICNSSHMTPFVVLVDAHDVIDQVYIYIYYYNKNIIAII